MSTRRTFLDHVAGMASAVAIVRHAEAHSDADLIAACNEYLRIQRAFEAYYNTLPDDVADDDPAWAMLDPLPDLTERLVALRATTTEGHMARARVVAFQFLPTFSGCQDDPGAPSHDRLRAAALRDLVFAERGAAT